MELSVPRVKAYFKEKIRNQQVEYAIEILTPTNTRFVPLKGS